MYHVIPRGRFDMLSILLNDHQQENTHERANIFRHLLAILIGRLEILRIRV